MSEATGHAEGQDMILKDNTTKHDVGMVGVEGVTTHADLRLDMVNHPPHYTTHPSGVEQIQVSQFMSFCLGNVIKYIFRADLKNNAIEDLKKAQFYLDREIKLRGNSVKPKCHSENARESK